MLFPGDLMLKSVISHGRLLITSLLLLAVACAPTGIYHTVKPGQTLYRIARTYDIDEGRLARINNIRDPTELRVNQRLYIPGARQLRQVPATAAAPTDRTVDRAAKQSAPTARSTAPVPSKKPPVQQPDKAVRQPAVNGQPAKGFFIWPAQGKLLSRFGQQGEKVYKGIEIGLPPGSNVVAAASGKVIYSGNAIAGYGNLIILEHSDNFFSVYGYNTRNLVEMNDHVGQGDKIALSGRPPSGQSARLHFEIRKGKSAVNPILYLP